MVFVTLLKLELLQRRTDRALRKLRRLLEDPRMSDYVVAAFAVVWFVLLVYVAVVGLRTARIAREVELLTRLVERRQDDQTH